VNQRSDTSLLKRIADGDVTAMQLAMDEYGGLIWSLARRFCPTPSEAEDGVQEAFISLWESAGRYDPDKGTEVTFVATIARRRLIDRGRRHTRRERVIAEVRESATPDASMPSEPVSTKEEAQRVRKAMEKLSDDQRRVIDLAVTHGCTHEQIATITELPLGTVKTHARRGLMRIRAMLNESPTNAAVRADR